MADKNVTAPRFSVIVPTFDRPGQLRACLEGLARQTLPASAFEIIVVDDAGTADESQVVGAWPELEITLLREDRGGPGAARNLGAKRARGRYLAFIDDDCVPDPGWLDGLDQSALQLGAIVGGTIENALPSNPYSTASQLIQSFVYQYHDEDNSHERFFTTNNLALPREAFESLGGFDTSIPAGTAEDKDLCDRWRAAGGEMVRP
jgi:glycosyltransferase involved in cell wall biosynthesis